MDSPARHFEATTLRAMVAGLALALGTPQVAHAEGEGGAQPAPATQGEGAQSDHQALVQQFRETVTQVKYRLLEVDRQTGEEKTRRKREALDLLSKAYIVLQRIPENVQEEEQLGELRRYVEERLKEIANDPEIKRIRDTTLAKAIRVFRAGNLNEALIFFDELRMMDPTDEGVAFMVRHIGNLLDDSESK